MGVRIVGDLVVIAAQGGDPAELVFAGAFQISETNAPSPLA